MDDEADEKYIVRRWEIPGQSELQKIIDDYARKGYDLVSCNAEQEKDGTSNLVCIFKERD